MRQLYQNCPSGIFQSHSVIGAIWIALNFDYDRQCMHTFLFYRILFLVIHQSTAKHCLSCKFPKTFNLKCFEKSHHIFNVLLLQSELSRDIPCFMSMFLLAPPPSPSPPVEFLLNVICYLSPPPATVTPSSWPFTLFLLRESISRLEVTCRWLYGFHGNWFSNMSPRRKKRLKKRNLPLMDSSGT